MSCNGEQWQQRQKASSAEDCRVTFFCMICVDSSFFCNNESNDVANTSSRVNFQSFGPGHDYDAYSTRFWLGTSINSPCKYTPFSLY